MVILSQLLSTCFYSFFTWFSEVNKKDDSDDDENEVLEIQDEVKSNSSAIN